MKPRSFWDMTKYLDDKQNDLTLSRVAVTMRGITLDGKRFDLTPDQARAVISKLTVPQLMSLNTLFSKLTLGSAPSFTMKVPPPLPIPHWKRELKAEDKLAPENRDLINRMVASAHAELADSALSDQRAGEHLETVLQGLEKVQAEEKITDKFAPTDLYASKPQEDAPPVLPKVERHFALAAVLPVLHSVLTSNLLLFPAEWESNKLVFRYVGKRELLALHQLYPELISRERQMCAMSLVSVNGEWCLSSLKTNPLALEVVDSWVEKDIEKIYPKLVNLRDYANSLLPYLEAAPSLRLLRDFWDTNKHYGKWWAEDLTGIPGASLIPPVEHIDAFIRECITEEQEVERLVAEDDLALQVGSMSHDLAVSLQNRLKETQEARNQHVKFMLYNEVPRKIQEDSPNQVHIPAEASQEEMVAHIENMHQGKMDYHDLMLSLLRQRKESMEKLHPQNSPTVSEPPASKGEAYEGGTHYASSAEILDMQRIARDKRRAMDKEIYEFSSEAVENITKNRKRSLLLEGKDPYHETDNSVDLGPASRISRTKNF